MSVKETLFTQCCIIKLCYFGSFRKSVFPNMEQKTVIFLMQKAQAHGNYTQELSQSKGYTRGCSVYSVDFRSGGLVWVFSAHNVYLTPKYTRL